jgi:hypothetical protein
LGTSENIFTDKGEIRKANLEGKSSHLSQSFPLHSSLEDPYQSEFTPALYGYYRPDTRSGMIRVKGALVCPGFRESYMEIITWK